MKIKLGYMRATTKKKLWIINAVLSVMSFLLIYATVWLSRGEALQLFYFDSSELVHVSCMVISAFAVGIIHLNPHEKDTKVKALIFAVSVLCFAIVLTIFALLGIPYDKSTIIRLWRYFVGTAIYYVISIIYAITAFVKTKQEDKTDEPIPYSD